MFDKSAVKRWRRVVHKELRWLNLPSEDAVYRACMVLAAVYCFGTDVGVLVEVCGHDRAFVVSILRRARKTRMLTGQTLRVGWNDKHGVFAWAMDAMTAAGDLYRPPDPKRSVAARARKKPVERKAQAPRQKLPPGTVFTPKVVRSNPLYGLAEWEKNGEPERISE